MGNVCVLTGDLVNSQQYDTSTYIDTLAKILRELESDKKISPPQHYRGDEFQLTTTPQWGLPVAIYIRAALKAENADWDARISVACGSAEQEDGSYGTAYLASGKGLDSLVSDERFLFNYCVNVDCDNDIQELDSFIEVQGAISKMLDFFMSNWTSNTALAVKARIFAENGNVAAKKANMSASSLSKALKRGSYETVMSAVTSITKVINV